MAAANQTSIKDLKVQLEEAQIRAQLSEARAKNTEAVLRIKKARIVNEIISKDNILDYIK